MERKICTLHIGLRSTLTVIHCQVFLHTTQRRTRIYPRFGLHKCTSCSLVEFSPEPFTTRRRLEEKKDASRFIVNTKPALDRILTENTSMQADNTTNERPIEAAEAEGSGNSYAAAAARNKKQQMESFVATPPICWTER